jgi:hypothetical protein
VVYISVVRAGGTPAVRWYGGDLLCGLGLGRGLIGTADVGLGLRRRRV